MHATIRCRTARIVTALGVGTPMAADLDRRGEGVIDFEHRRVAVTDRLATDRKLAETRQEWKRGIGLMEFLSTQRELFFDGGREYRRVVDGWIAFGEAGAPLTTNNPAWVLAAVAVWGTRLEDAGSELVNDVVCKRFRLTVALDQPERAACPVENPREKRRWLPRLGARQREQVPVELWFDPDGRIRRASHTPLQGKRSDRDVWQIIELADFGVPGPLLEPPRLAESEGGA